jgi:diguanylate cyclase (GGDEF)-like protein
MTAALRLAASNDEEYRLHVLEALELLDTPAEAEFEALVQIAKQMLNCPIVALSLIDAERQWFKARCGLDVSETPREHAFCEHAIQAQRPLIINDAARDPRFAGNPLVTGAPYVRFYAGVPIFAALEPGTPRVPLGTICVIDTRPRLLTTDQIAGLENLARVAEQMIAGRTHVGNAVRYADERRAAAARLQRQTRVFGQAERMAGLGSWRLTLPDNALSWSDNVFAIHGLERDQMPPLDRALDHYPRPDRKRIEVAVARAIETGESFDLEADFVAADGVRKRVRTMGELEMADGAPVALIGVFQDVTERHAMEQALRDSAQRDALTGIRNRAGFNAALDAAMAQATAAAAPLALGLIDLDGFKQVNDVHGHQAGDELLREVARRLEAQGLGGCTAARLGGDEFALIVNGAADRAAVDAIAEAVLVALRAPIAITGGEVAISGTLGFAWLEPGLGRSAFMHRADLALYEAKRAGKNMARFWKPDAPSPVRKSGRRAGSRR